MKPIVQPFSSDKKSQITYKFDTVSLDHIHQNEIYELINLLQKRLLDFEDNKYGFDISRVFVSNQLYEFIMEFSSESSITFKNTINLRKGIRPLNKYLKHVDSDDYSYSYNCDHDHNHDNEENGNDSEDEDEILQIRPDAIKFNKLIFDFVYDIKQMVDKQCFDFGTNALDLASTYDWMIFFDLDYEYPEYYVSSTNANTNANTNSTNTN